MICDKICENLIYRYNIYNKMFDKVAHKIKNRDISKDVFYTPLKLVETHLNMFIDIPNDSIILDPFAGKKVYNDSTF